jgi:hypothetical protein
MQSAMWAAISPEAEFQAGGGSTGAGAMGQGGYVDPGEFPVALLRGGKGGIFGKVPHFGFLAVAGGTAVALWYVFEHGGAGGKVGGHVGPVAGEVDATLGKGEK